MFRTPLFLRANLLLGTLACLAMVVAAMALPVPASAHGAPQVTGAMPAQLASPAMHACCDEGTPQPSPHAGDGCHCAAVCAMGVLVPGPAPLRAFVLRMPVLPAAIVAVTEHHRAPPNPPPRAQVA